LTFSSTVFERLLFPLHKRVYKAIQDALDGIENKHPGKLWEILDNLTKEGIGYIFNISGGNRWTEVY
jgi:hypothetical protein